MEVKIGGGIMQVVGTSYHAQNTLPNYPPWIYGDGLERLRYFCRRGRALSECDRRGFPQPGGTGERDMMIMCACKN